MDVAPSRSTGLPPALAAFECSVVAIGVTSYPVSEPVSPPGRALQRLLWAQQGKARWSEPGGRRSGVLRPGTMLLIPPGTRCTVESDYAGPSRCTWADLEVVDPLGAVHAGARGPTPFNLPPDDVARPLFANVLWIDGRKPPGWTDLRDAAMRQLLLALLSGATSTASDHSPMPAVVETVLQHVRGEWSQGTLRVLSLAELARAGAVSPGHLNRLFRTTFDLPPIELLRLVRLHHAATLLARTRLTVSDIGRVTGFGATFELSRAFTAAYQVSPRTYRRLALARARRPDEAPIVARGLAGWLCPAPAGGG